MLEKVIAGSSDVLLFVDFRAVFRVGLILRW